jgi:pimeloyl-ACP methyl ester carboxylesterase
MISLAAALPDGVRSGFVDGVKDMRVHVLTAGNPAHPALLLLHGFPELAFSWRHLMAPLAAAGFYVIAPDQRGYGLTTGWHGAYEDDLAPFGLLNLADDAVAMLAVMGVESAVVIGHDFGSPVAGWCALTRPDVFTGVAMMSAPFSGPPAEVAISAVYDDFLALARPRKHYQRYYCEPGADTEMRLCPEGLSAFLRAYSHCKSGDWAGNAPRKLPEFSAAAMAEMPEYYIMDRDAGMAETAFALCAGEDMSDCTWLSDPALDVFAEMFAATTFQGGLNWYRATFDAEERRRQMAYAGRRIDIPTCFIAGAKDWGVHQHPGALEGMEALCTDWRSVTLVEGAGHWAQQEAPGAVVEAVLGFVRGI